MTAISLVAAAMLVGCADEKQGCTRKEDCAANEICSEGICSALLDDDAGPLDGPLADRGPEQGLDQQVWPDSGGDASTACVPNNNGIVERDELTFKVPTSVSFTVGSGLTVDLAGTMVGSTRHWDLTAAASDDQDQPMKLEAVPAWAATAFPTASYSSLLNEELDTVGIYRADQDALSLLGAISGSSENGKISYDPVVDLLRFPLQVGDAFSTDATGSGTWPGTLPGTWTPIYNSETYAVEVLARGMLKLPKLTLDALLVRTKVTQDVYFNPFLRRTWVMFLFVSECYGTVARIVSDTDPGSDLSAVQADERWRIANP